INTDDDHPGITVSPGVLVTYESGGADTYTIALHSQPVADVTITITSSDTTEAVVSPGVLTFAPAHWDTPRTVTVTGVDDFVFDGPQPFQILFDVASADPGYEGIVLPIKVGTNLDDDASG